VLSTREIDDWLKRANDPHTVNDRQVGLDTESGDEEADIEMAAARGAPAADAIVPDAGANTAPAP